MNKTPQIIVTLSPEGKLTVELPGVGTKRQISCRDSEFADTCKRILQAQAMDRTEIGLDGAPTQAQVRHWERHQIWADSHCRFCLAEGRAKPDHSRARHSTRVLISECNGVEVRKIVAGKSGQGRQRAKKTAQELGL